MAERVRLEGTYGGIWSKLPAPAGLSQSTGHRICPDCSGVPPLRQLHTLSGQSVRVLSHYPGKKFLSSCLFLVSKWLAPPSRACSILLASLSGWTCPAFLAGAMPHPCIPWPGRTRQSASAYLLLHKKTATSSVGMVHGPLLPCCRGAAPRRAPGKVSGLTLARDAVTLAPS